MEHCRQTSIALACDLVKLVSLQADHIPLLVELAKEKVIWQHFAVDGGDTAKLTSSLEEALEHQVAGTQLAFAIYAATGELAGSTRFLEINPQHRKLEIGWTWLHSRYWGTGINTACKLLLLTYAFEVLKVVRVQIKTDENNIRSQKAIEKTGAKKEGVLRNDMIRDNGTARNSVYYSIIDDEWPDAKNRLQQLSGK